MNLFSLAVIYVESPPERYDSAFSNLFAYLSKLKLVKITFFRVNNRLEGEGLIKKEGNTYFIYGNNSEREFSGWQEGLNFIRKQNFKFDVALIANSAFEADRTSFLKDYSNIFLITKSFFFNHVIGRIDSHGLETKLNDYNTKKWVCSNCIILPFKALNEIDCLVSIDSEKIKEYLPIDYPGPVEVFFKNAPINQIYKNHLIEWLTQNWHSKMELNEKNWPVFREKVKSIFNEALLSVRLKNLGYKLVSYGMKKYD